jgi:membrane-associated phospholipid phosphatase
MSLLSTLPAGSGAGLADAAHGAWHLVTRLGEAQILLPAMFASLLWLVLVARAPRTALWWLAATAVAASITTATKVAFFGHEVGYAPLDYTGISGHAMFAAAVLPVLAGIVAAGAGPRWRLAAVAAGYGLAAVIAYSRLAVGAHSAFEAVAGLALGSAASALALLAHRLPQTRPPLWLGIGLLLWMLSLPVGAPPSPTHSWVVQLSLAVSDRAQPYSRQAMHRDHRREMKRRRAAELSALASTQASAQAATHLR